MCGIAGILNYRSVESIDLEKSVINMLSVLNHRGPDGWGLYLSNNIALGHTRLSIVDIEGGHQPMMSNRYSISFNGEIFNYIEIREELKKQGVVFRTKSDTEVVLKSFEVYGVNALKYFNGQFAFLIWDRKEKELIIARDRFGIRPLYILRQGDCFFFSSEIKAFDTIKKFDRVFDMQKLYEHALLWNTLDDSTVYKNIRSLPAGTFEIYKENANPKNIRFYEIGESNGSFSGGIEAAQEELINLLDDSVKLRLRSDVPVGAYLSGGIDSSVITHLTAKNNSKKFRTFSIAFEDEEYDESSYQNEMVKKINSDHYCVNISYKDIDENFFKAVYNFERPVFRTAGVPLYMLSEAVRRNNIKVVLTGEGADEILYGYDSFKELKLLKLWAREPCSKIRPLLIKKLYPHLQHYNNPKKFGLMRMYYEGFLENFENKLTGLNIRAHNNQIMSNYFNKDYNLSFNKEELIERVDSIIPENFNNWSLLKKNQFLEMKTLLSGYLLSSQGDRMSMSHSVEGRYPFLDHRLVEKLFYYKDSYKLSGFSQKYILGKAFKKHIPSSIINRAKKPYTSPDLKSFFYEDGLSEKADYFLCDERINDYGLFDPKFVKRLVNKFNKRLPKEIGYRDNMLVTFILSAQMVNYWAKNPVTKKLDEEKMTVRIEDY